MSVNEEDYRCMNLLVAGPRGRWRGRGVGVVVCCPAHTGNGVTWAVLYSGLFECVCGVDMWVLCV